MLSTTLRYHRTRSQDISSHYSLLKTKAVYSVLKGFITNTIAMHGLRLNLTYFANGLR